MDLLVFAVLAVAAYSVYSGTTDTASADSIDPTITDPNADATLTDSGVNMGFAAEWAKITARYENVTAATNSAAAQASNNPGGVNIIPGSTLWNSLPGITGRIAGAGGPNDYITTFDTPENGMNAMQVVLQGTINAHPNLTIVQAISRYITGSTDPNAHPAQTSGIFARATALANSVGASINDAIGTLP